MVDEIQTVLVDIRIEGFKVVVIHRLRSLGLMIELDRVRAPATESITRVKWGDNVKLIESRTAGLFCLS